MGCLVSTQSEGKSRRRKKAKPQTSADDAPACVPQNVDTVSHTNDDSAALNKNTSAVAKETVPSPQAQKRRTSNSRPRERSSSSSSSDRNRRVKHPLLPPSHVDDSFEKPNQQQCSNALALPPTTFDRLVPLYSGDAGVTQDPRKYSMTSSAHLRSDSLVPVDHMPHYAGQSDDGSRSARVDPARCRRGLGARQFVEEDGDVSERDPASTTTSDLLLDSDLEDAPLSEEMYASLRALPEASFEILPITHLVHLVLDGTMRLDEPEEDIMPSLRTKMRYRDVDGWLSEIGHLPAPVQALVHASAERGAGPMSPKLSLKVLEQNERLLLQLKSRTTPSAALVNRDTSRTLAVPRSGQGDSTPIGGDDAGESFEEQRRGSRASGNRFRHASAAKDFGAGVADFYQELETEERRLSTLKSSSDEEFD